MANAIKWSSLDTYTTVIDGLTASPTLKTMANAARVLSNAIDNTASGTHWQYADFDLKAKFGTNPSAGATFDMYFMLAVDGTNYADGDSSIAPPTTAFVGSFPLRAVTTAQRVALQGIVLPPGVFKVLLVNSAGQTTTSVDSDNVLSYRRYADEVQ